MSKTITMRADENADDCFADAVERYVARHPEAEGYDFSPRWADNTRERVELDVPYTDEMRLEDAESALEAAGYDISRASDEQRIILAVTDPGDDDDAAAATLAELRDIVGPGFAVEWTGNSDTGGDGYSTADVSIEVVS